MAKSNNRYIQFYTPGTAAVKVQIRDEREWAPLPEPKAEPKILIPVDPVAVIGFVVAVCMLVMMAFGIYQLNAARQEVAVMEQYVAQLTAENQQLKKTYEDGYDLDLIRQQALDMGMVPAEEIPVRQIYITLPTKAASQQVSLWETITLFFQDLIA